MENIKEMTLVGYYSFKSKDKNITYYVVQVLNHLKTDNSLKGVLINIFVDEETYNNISNLDIGCLINVECNINYETNKVFYKILL